MRDEDVWNEPRLRMVGDWRIESLPRVPITLRTGLRLGKLRCSGREKVRPGSRVNIAALRDGILNCRDYGPLSLTRLAQNFFSPEFFLPVRSAVPFAASDSILWGSDRHPVRTFIQQEETAGIRVRFGPVTGEKNVFDMCAYPPHDAQ